jgi:2-hydroxycyclohexanecarboxyl-CoA dehydrogenase
MKRKIGADLGDVHVLVNCAGGDIGARGGRPNPKTAVDIELEDIRVHREQFDRRDVGLPGLRAAYEAARRRLHHQHRGGGTPRLSPEVIYLMVKTAVVHYTRCLAKKLIDDGVRINAVSPGATQTALSRRPKWSIRSAWIRARNR